MNAQIVTVHCDMASRTLTVDPPGDMHLTPESPLAAWQFVGIPNNWAPAIEWLDQRPYGPFHSQRHTGEISVGQGNNGQPGRYRYQAMIVARPASPDAPPETIQSQEHAVVNEIAVEDTSPDTIVRVMPDNSLDVIQKDLRIFAGDVTTWYFQGVPEGYYLSIFFFDGPGGAAYRQYGPFETFSWCRLPVAGGGLDFKLVGAGNNGIPGLYTYEVRLFDPTGRQVARICDPRVDNSGPPIGGS